MLAVKLLRRQKLYRYHRCDDEAVRGDGPRVHADETIRALWGRTRKTPLKRTKKG